MAEIDLSDADDVESLLWTCKECYVYQIPPLKNESGHRANDWDVNKWLWSGALKVTSKGNTLNIILHAPDTGELFACCPRWDSAFINSSFGSDGSRHAKQRRVGSGPSPDSKLSVNS